MNKAKLIWFTRLPSEDGVVGAVNVVDKFDIIVVEVDWIVEEFNWRVDEVNCVLDVVNFVVVDFVVRVVVGFAVVVPSIPINLIILYSHR